jgi:hypothetical protein
VHRSKDAKIEVLSGEYPKLKKGRHPMDKRPFVERILETENLTDQLEDAEANLLLDWGTAQLDRILQGMEDVEAAGARVNALMAVMRKINRILGSREDTSAEYLEADLLALSGLLSSAFGTADSGNEHSINKEVIGHAVTQLPGLPAHQALELLVGWGSEAKPTK